MQIMTKKITFFINLIFYHREIVKLDFMTLSLSNACKHRSVMQPLQNPFFVGAPILSTVDPGRGPLIDKVYKGQLANGSQELSEWSCK